MTLGPVNVIFAELQFDKCRYTEGWGATKANVFVLSYFQELSI